MSPAIFFCDFPFLSQRLIPAPFEVPFINLPRLAWVLIITDISYLSNQRIRQSKNIIRKHIYTVPNTLPVPITVNKAAIVNLVKEIIYWWWMMNSCLLGSQDQPTSSPVLLYIKPSPTGWPFSFTLLLIFRVIKQKHCQRHCRPRHSLLLPNLQLDRRKNLIVAICTHLNNFIASLDSCNKL